MNAFLCMLKSFFTSKKVLTALLTGVAAATIKDPGLRTNAIEIGAVLIGAQGLTDHGKAAAETTAAADKAPTS